MTEDEAKTKWCPFVRHAYTTDAFETIPPALAVNRSVDERLQVLSCSCIGSACMAWRWTEPTDYEREMEHSQRGYCGLAGKP